MLLRRLKAPANTWSQPVSLRDEQPHAHPQGIQLNIALAENAVHLNANGFTERIYHLQRLTNLALPHQWETIETRGPLQQPQQMNFDLARPPASQLFRLLINSAFTLDRN